MTNLLEVFGLPPNFFDVLFTPYEAGPISQRITGFANSNPLLAALLGFIIFDVLSGLFASAKAGQLASPISFSGMMKKAEELTVVAAFHLFEWLLFKAVNQTWPLAGTIMWGFIFYELISILENADRSGLPLPAWLKPLMASMKQKTEEANLAAIAGLLNKWGLSPGPVVNIAPNAEKVEVNHQGAPIPGQAGATTSTTTTTTTTTPGPAGPGPGPGPGSNTGPMNYTVVVGDNLDLIAALFGVSVEALILSNNLALNATLTPGQVLIIPGKAV